METELGPMRSPKKSIEEIQELMNKAFIEQHEPEIYTVTKQRIVIIPSIEYEKYEGLECKVGMAFNLAFDDIIDERFVYGAVGRGETMGDAQYCACAEWLNNFMPHFVSALLRKKNGTRLGKLIGYASSMIIWHRNAYIWPSNTPAPTDALKLLFIPIIERELKEKKLKEMDFSTIYLEILCDLAGHKSGYFRLNGRPKGLLEGELLTIPWPSENQIAIYKQHFIYVPIAKTTI